MPCWQHSRPRVKGWTSLYGGAVKCSELLYYVMTAFNDQIVCTLFLSLLDEHSECVGPSGIKLGVHDSIHIRGFVFDRAEHEIDDDKYKPGDR